MKAIKIKPKELKKAIYNPFNYDSEGMYLVNNEVLVYVNHKTHDVRYVCAVEALERLKSTKASLVEWGLIVYALGIVTALFIAKVVS